MLYFRRFSLRARVVLLKKKTVYRHTAVSHTCTRHTRQSLRWRACHQKNKIAKASAASQKNLTQWGQHKTAKSNNRQTCRISEIRSRSKLRTAQLSPNPSTFSPPPPQHLQRGGWWREKVVGFVVECWGGWVGRVRNSTVSSKC